MEGGTLDNKQRYDLCQQLLIWAKKQNDPIAEAATLIELGNAVQSNGDNDMAFKLELQGRKLAEKYNDKQVQGIAYIFSANIPTDIKIAEKKIRQALPLVQAAHDSLMIGYCYFGLANCYQERHLPDSAKIYGLKTLAVAVQTGDYLNVVYGLATLAGLTNDTKLKLKYLYYNEQIANNAKNNYAIYATNLDLGAYYFKQNQPDSSLLYSRKSLQAGKRLTAYEQLSPLGLLSKVYTKKRNLDSAIKYTNDYHAIKDSIYNNANIVRTQSQEFEEQQRQRDVASKQSAYKNKVRLLLLGVISAVLLLLAFIFWRNNKKTRKLNLLLQEQKQQVQSALQELKVTQSQLIQSEKMASLGELTAGIAHEIQNPLNFVNNFSEVNLEMIAELMEELQAGNTKEALSLAADIEGNESKIYHHGKRADSIVKGMLEHSRASSGQKEATDLNKLADEYLRLAYHGLRAKDKSFNAELITRFDSTLPLVKIIPQDMGRVLLNLFNNAFYSLQQKQKAVETGYQPAVELSTRLSNNHVEIVIEDNGTGIPAAIKEKIMQPFFTTKAAGEGTGLGLSLSYDIVVKGHGGKLTAVSQADHGAAFTILLPVK
ncbi:MAG: hypothetical protein EOP45_04945 [Sphingobacteriaceae bacterium]|nr:MAG: hypothetical protein EOP45_04945 [Sphingobacteriaceae bacterium]